MKKLLLVALSVTAIGASHPAFSAEDNEWYLLNGLLCELHDPREMIALLKVFGVTPSMKDVKEAGKVVATTITAPDGSSGTYYRGKARCERALKRDFDRYK